MIFNDKYINKLFMSKNKKVCKNCKHWKNSQSELEYSVFFGICTCYKWKFNPSSYGDIRVLDRNNLSSKHMNVHTFENTSKEVPVGKVEKSRYCFVTEETFGCIHFL